MNEKEVVFQVLDRLVLEWIEARDNTKREDLLNEIFGLIETLENQEAARNWVAESIFDLSDDDEFIQKGIKFIRPEAFKKAEKPEEREISEISHGEEGTT